MDPAPKLPPFPGCGIGDEAGRTIESQLAAHRQLGWRAIELRSVDGLPLVALSRTRVAEITRKVRDAGVDVPVLDSTIGDWNSAVTGEFQRDVDELEALARMAHALEAPGIRVMSYPQDGCPEREWRREVVRRVAELARRAEQHGLMLLHENCSGWAATSASRTLDLVASVASPALRLLFDIGNPIAHGYDGHAYLEAVAPLVEHVHVKDAVRVGPDDDDVAFVLPGRGEARVLDCLGLIARHGFAGTLSVEPHVAFVYHRGKAPDDRRLTESYVEYGQHVEALLASASIQPSGDASEGELERQPQTTTRGAP